MVQRYSTYGADWECETYLDVKGELVKYEDYERLRNIISVFLDCAEYSMDTDKLMCIDPRRELSELLERKL